MEKNREFLDFISVCYNRVHINKEAYKILSGADMDLKEYFNEFMEMFHTKNDYSTMIKCMEQVIKNKPSDEDCGEYLLEYKRYVRDCFKVVPQWVKEVRTLEDLYETIKYSDLELCDGFYNAKIFSFNSMKFRYKDKVHIIARGKDLFNIKINGSDTNVGGIIIKDGNAEFIRINCIEDEIKFLINIITRKDYSLILVPNFDLFAKNKIKDFGIKGLTNKEFFDLRYIIENCVVYNNKNILEDYKYVRNHHIKIGNLFNVLDDGLNFDVSIRLLRIILEYLESFKGDNFEKLFEHIKNILDQRMKSNYLYTTDINTDFTKMIQVLKNKELGIEDFLRVLKDSDVGKDIIYKDELYLIDLDKRGRKLKTDSDELKEIIKSNRYLFISHQLQWII